MAPRKSVKTEKAAEDTIEKPAKKTIKEEKPNLKKPTDRPVIKLKIPRSCLGKKLQKNAKINGKALPKLTKAEIKQMELKLTNEVAKCQLTKGNPTIEIIEESISDKKDSKTTRKRKRNAENSEELVVDPSVENVPVKPQKKKSTLRRKPPDSVSNQTQITDSLENAAPAPVTPQKRKIVLKRNRAVTTSNKAEVEKERIPKRTTKQLKPTNSAVINTRRRAARIVSLEKNKNETVDNNLENILTNDCQSSSTSIQISKFKKFKNPNRNKSRTGSPVSYKSAHSINSQRTSETSISGCLSWTKDISSSSTTTCVTVGSSDFVRIDGKLPILHLSDIEIKLKDINENFKNDGELSLPNSEGSVADSMSLLYASPEINSFSQTLNLSTSSPSVKSQNAVNIHENDDDNNINKIGKALDTLLPKLENFDLEIMNWVGSANEDINTEVEVLQNRILKMLKEENDVISHCKNIKSILFDKPVPDQKSNDVRNEDSQKEIITQTDFSRAIVPEIRNEEPKGGNNCILVTNNDDMMLDDNLNDDDDALSIYADSITDIEPSKGNNVAPSFSNVKRNIIEEYVPKPIHKNTLKQTQSITYRPTKIQNLTEDETVVQTKNKSVCEKQYADSTSINKEIERQKNFIELVESNQVVNVNKPPSLPTPCVRTSLPSNQLKCPRLMVHLYKPITGPRSVIFHDICFHNLISKCKKPLCMFPHIQLDVKEVCAKIICLNQEQFIQEYMLIRNWPGLRRIYGMYFVIECRRRSLSRILVEMSIDFIMKANVNVKDDVLLKRYVIEATLLHLNDISLNACEDLLTYDVGGTLLCDMFMQAIAVAQNFSQFKLVFINLTNFIVRIGRTFQSEVAILILERLCVLPFEEHTVRAMIKIIKNTNASVFENAMMAQFEKLLASSDSNCHEEFLSIKNAVYTNQIEPPKLCDAPPLINQDFNQMNSSTLMYSETEKRYTSPDTTNLDNLNKAPDTLKVTRTVDLNRLNSFSVTMHSKTDSHSSDSNEGKDYFMRNKFNRNWRFPGRQMVNRERNWFSPRPNRGAIRSPWPVNRRRTDVRHVAYGTSPVKNNGRRDTNIM